MGKLGRLLSHATLMLYVLLILLPLVWVFESSFKSNIEIAQHPWSLPDTFTLKYYREAWQTAKIGIYFLNSLKVSLGTSLVTVLLCAAAAYALVRMRYPLLSKWVTAVLMLGMLVPAGALLIPIFFLNIQLHINNTHWALFFPYLAFGIPFNTLVMTAFMRSIPGELEEAGVMDGLTAFGIFRRIVLPVSVPVLVTVFILAYLNNWNEFVMANFYLDDDALRTLPVGMAAFQDAFSMNYSGLSAGMMYSIIPVVILYAVLQDKIIEGITAGSVKG